MLSILKKIYLPAMYIVHCFIIFVIFSMGVAIGKEHPTLIGISSSVILNVFLWIVISVFWTQHIGAWKYYQGWYKGFNDCKDIYRPNWRKEDEAK